MSEIECVREGDVAIIRLNRPEVLNAQTPQMWSELAALGDEFAESARAVVLTGSGDNFSAGLDRRMFSAEGIPGSPSLFTLAQMSDEDVLRAIAEFQKAFTIWHDAPFVSVAAVEGHAIGAGFQLALACDVIIAGRSASFAMKEVSWGLVPDLAGTAPLTDRLGQTRALSVCLSGATISVEEPGLVNHVVEDGTALANAQQYAEGLPETALSREMKGLIRAYGHEERVAQRERERRAQLRRIRSLAKAMS